MALLHQADLSPTKLELLAHWLPEQSWFQGDATAPLTTVGSFRFDDPDGQVGLETLLVRAGDGPVLQVPLTYRNERLPGAEEHFVGTMEHSVLGTRWTYDALGDLVYLRELARVILTGGTQSELWIELDGVMTQREPTARVQGSGTETDPDVDSYTVKVIRTPGAPSTHRVVLTGTWEHQQDAVALAWVVEQ